jgi:transcriptional regulator GlxA family with amidase domain
MARAILCVNPKEAYMTIAQPHIVFAIYDGMTHLDFTGPHQFLSRLPGARITVASRDGGAVGADGLTFAGTDKLDEVAGCDLICVPGGANATAVAGDPGFIRPLQRLAAQASYVTSVCTGSLILGAAGLLRDKRAGCHWAWRHLLAEFGAIPVAERVVRDGRCITGGGVTAGIDFALVVIAELAGDDAAQAVQLGLEYDPQPPFGAGTPDRAPAAILATVRARLSARMPQWEAEAREAAFAAR